MWTGVVSPRGTVIRVAMCGGLMLRALPISIAASPRFCGFCGVARTAAFLLEAEFQAGIDWTDKAYAVSSSEQ